MLEEEASELCDPRSTIIIRHYRERRSKCTVQPLLGRPEYIFRTYQRGGILNLADLPDLSTYVRLSMEGPPLDPEQDRHRGILLVDGTWRYAAKMTSHVEHVPARSLPGTWITAYPRRQEDAPDPNRGLASIEALYIAMHILGRDHAGLLDAYHWREQFLAANPALMR